MNQRSAPPTGAPRTAAGLDLEGGIHGTLRRIARKVSHEWLGVEAALRLLTEAAAEALAVDRVTVWLNDDLGSVIRCVDAYDRARDEHDPRGELEASRYPRYFRALLEERVIDASEAAADPRTLDLADDYVRPLGITSMLDAPVWMAGALAGVVCHEHLGPTRRWTENEKDFAAAVGDLCSLILETGRREKAEVDLRRTKDKYRRFFKGTRVGLLEVAVRAPVDRLRELAERAGVGPGRYLTRHPGVLGELAAEARIVAVNDAAVRLFAAPDEAALRHTFEQFDAPGLDEAFRELVVTLASGESAFEVEIATRTFENRHLDVLVSGQLFGEPGSDTMVVDLVDTTSRKKVERLLEDVARGVTGATGASYFRSLAKFISRRLGADLTFVGELTEDRRSVRTLAAWRDGRATEDFEYRLAGSPCGDVLEGGVCIHLEGVTELYPDDDPLVSMGAEGYAGIPLRGAASEALGILVAVYRTPIRDRHLVESGLRIMAARASAELERIRAEAERTRLQEQLFRAQRLESVGRLAGGIAHDFNNLLAPIMAYAELSMEALEETHPIRGELAVIRDAAERASRLTKQLLAFSRRQILAMRTLDLNEVVQDFRVMLRTVMREDVEVVVSTHPDLPAVRGDEVQIEQTLMNLVVNARDAMPDGGTLRVATGVVTLSGDDLPVPELAPGLYVVLSVADTGHGMDEATLAQLFEPFFTTKSALKGTGLGLATVYGIVQQHGGAIRVESAPGQGTRFEIYLPATTPMEKADVRRPGPDERPRGSERILVVEDEPAVRQLVCNILRRQGYDVVDVPGPHEALHLLEERGQVVDLLLTDVVMPEMNGVELFRRLSRSRPGFRVLYMSGYAHNVLAEKGLEGSVDLLHKPFSVAELAGRVRRALDA